MQENIYYSIEVTKKYPEVASVLKEYFDESNWDEDYQKKWAKATEYDSVRCLITNYNDDLKMYVLDYDHVKNSIYEIIDKIPDCEFKGSVEYMNSIGADGESCSFSYKNGDLEIKDYSDSECGDSYYDPYYDPYDEEE